MGVPGFLKGILGGGVEVAVILEEERCAYV